MMTHDRISPETDHRHSGDRFSENETGSTRRGISALLHDSIALIELQIRLFTHDFHQLRTGSGPGLLMLAVGIVLAFATVPVFLLGLGWMLAAVSGWSVWVAMITVGILCGVAPALALIVLGWKSLQQKAAVMNRSATELRRNTDWLKRRLKSSF